MYKQSYCWNREVSLFLIVIPSWKQNFYCSLAIFWHIKLSFNVPDKLLFIIIFQFKFYKKCAGTLFIDSSFISGWENMPYLDPHLFCRRAGEASPVFSQILSCIKGRNKLTKQMVFIEYFKEMVLHRGCFEITQLGCFNKLTTIFNSKERK